MQLIRDGVIRTANFAGRSETTYQGDPVDVAESVAAALLAGARVPDIQDYQNAWPRTRFDNLAATVGMTCDWSVSGQWWFPWSSGPVPASAQLQWGTATLSAGVAPTTPTTWADLHWKDDFVRDPRYSSYDSGGLGEYTADPVAAVSWDPLKVHWQCGALEGDSTTLASGQGIVLTIGGTPPWENTPQYPDDFNSIGGRAEPFLWPDGGGSVVLNRSVDGGPTPPLVGDSVDDAILTLPGEQEVSLNLFSWQYLGTGEWSEMLHGGAIEGHWNADFSGSVSFNVASDPQTQPRVTLTTGPFRYWQPGQQSMEPPDLTGAPGPSAMRFAAGVI